MQMNVAFRWTARIWSIGSTLFILPFLLPREFGSPTANEFIGLLLFPVGVVLGFGIAWWREGIGGMITVSSLALFYLWMFTRDGKLPTGPYFVLLAAPGFIFIAASVFSRSKAGLSAGTSTENLAD